MKDITITYQNYIFVNSCPVGWTISMDIEINEETGKLYDILSKVLNVSGDGLLLSASVSLGTGHSWTARPKISTFAVEGILKIGPNQIAEYSSDNNDMVGLQLCPNVVLSRVGILFYGISVPSLGLDSTEWTDYGFTVFGDMHIKVPGSIKPLELDFEIGEFEGAINLAAAVRGDIWKNAFGIGIDLDMVRLSATFDSSGPLETLQCSVSAHLKAGATTALVDGTYTPGGSYSIYAYVQNLGCDGVADLFRHRTGEELLLPSHVDITIGSAMIEISNEKKLSIVVDKLEFDHYTSVNAVVELSSKGALVRAQVDRVKLPGDIGIDLTSAYMQVAFEKKGSGKSTDVMLGGNVVLEGFSLHAISAGVHLYKTATSNQLEWTVYGTFTDLQNTTTLGQLFPGLQNSSFLKDFALQDLMFIAASRDDPSLSQMNPQKYPIKKGVQFSALFGLVLSAAWSTGNSFLLDVILPTDTMVHLGDGITTDPITITIDTSQLLLRIATGVKVPVPGSTTPLDFTASLTIKGETVKLAGEMHGLWQNPFGISKSVSIGPFLELELDIDLLVFPETGLPTSFSFAGGLTIGESEGDVAVEVSENPSQELLTGRIQKFGIRDIVAFAAQITELDIPPPPDFIDFEDIDLYMSTGVTLGTQSYPAGFSFHASLVLFGTKIQASAEVTGGVLKANGSIDDLKVGPLQITGQDSKQASLDLQIGSTTQILKVDGAIEFLDAYIGLTLDLEIMPKPKFSFNFTLHFTDLLTFIVDAEMIESEVDLKDLSKLGFKLHALFEQHLVEYIRGQVHASLEALEKRADDSIDAAKAAVAEKEKEYQKGIQNAKAKLDKAYRSWVTKSNQVHVESQAFIDSYMKQLHILQGNVDNERLTFNAKLKKAEGGVQHANADRAAKMRAAEAEVSKAKSKWDSDVAKAEAGLETAKQTMHQKFGSAEADIEAAKRKVDEVQGEIDSTRDRISYCENAHWYRFDLKAELAYLGPKLLVLRGYKATADGILDLAEKVVEGADYINTKAAIPAAEELVKTAGNAGDLAFRAAQSTLHEVDRDTGALLDQAESLLKSVQKEGDALLRAAEYALQKFVESQKSLLDAAQRAIDNLVHSAEWLAYQAASGVLDLASHATHALDIAKKALDAAKQVVDGTIKISEATIEGILKAFDITRIELIATLDSFLNKNGGAHFVVEVDVLVLGNKETLRLELDMGNTAQFINDIFHK
ncbi:hypothetical protein BN14_04942 [Rhizoctonia solani AG-1 IB]|uniref:Uncharacterized protein n=1 Tax=Thanatephorus cucumeris (strain AG1-IB / isolate 7/3/14) TaxID=1108050 RepID=M5BUM5_THACB|nr:hypothetical protein BN14_04942 [Rhizoctonia solani AG-1 IB]